MDIKTLNKLKKLRDDVRKSNNEIIKERDKIKEYLDEYQEIYESIFDGTEDIQQGIDRLSEYL